MPIIRYFFENKLQYILQIEIKLKIMKTLRREKKRLNEKEKY